MGRHKEPLERMAAKSPDGKTPGHRELEVKVEVVPDRTVPDPPIELTGRGAVEWRNIWTAGWWLQRDQDYHWVEMVAQAYSDIEEWRRQVKEDGLVVPGWNGQLAAHPLIKSINQAQQTIQKCLSILGLSPSDRARLMLTEAKTRSTLQEMIAGAGTV